jgi:hypothetical protein
MRAGALNARSLRYPTDPMRGNSLGEGATHVRSNFTLKEWVAQLMQGS